MVIELSECERMVSGWWENSGQKSWNCQSPELLEQRMFLNAGSSDS